MFFCLHQMPLEKKKTLEILLMSLSVRAKLDQRRYVSIVITDWVELNQCVSLTMTGKCRPFTRCLLRHMFIIINGNLVGLINYVNLYQRSRHDWKNSSYCVMHEYNCLLQSTRISYNHEKWCYIPLERQFIRVKERQEKLHRA